MTKAAGFTLLFAAGSALSVQGTGLGLNPSVYILQSLHNSSDRENPDFTLPRDLEQNVILGNLSLYPYLNPSHRLADELNNRRKGLFGTFKLHL